MRKSKRWLASLLAMVLLLSCFSGTAMAAGTKLLILRGPETAKVGDEVEVLIDAVAGGVVADGKLTVGYDAASLRYVGAEAGEAWQEDADVALSVNANAGKVILAFAGKTAADAGTIIKLRFTALAEGSAKVAVVDNGSNQTYVTGAKDYDLSAETTVQITPADVEEYCTVTFIIAENGAFEDGSKEIVREIKAGEAIGTPPTVVPENGYVFSGWQRYGQDTVYTSAEVAAMKAEAKWITFFTAVITKAGEPVDPVRPVWPSKPTEPTVPDQPLLPSDTSTECDGGVNCPTNKFTDLHYTGDFHKALDFMVSNGYMNGISDTAFGPNDAMTRAMMVTILYRLAGQPAVEGNMPFADVAEGSYYYNAVKWAVGKGITTGTSATAFSPDDMLTREQIVAFLFRYAAYTGKDTSARADLSGYTDAGTVSSYAADAMQWAVGSGIVNGVTATTLQPKAQATRAQIAVMVWRFETAGQA